MKASQEDWTRTTTSVLRLRADKQTAPTLVSLLQTDKHRNDQQGLLHVCICIQRQLKLSDPDRETLFLM